MDYSRRIEQAVNLIKEAKRKAPRGSGLHISQRVIFRHIP
jgi:hypothetical protein